MNQTQRKLIIEHGEKLKLFFNLPLDTDSIILCKSLRRLEKKAENRALDNCNIGVSEDTYLEQKRNILQKVDKILNFKKQKIKVFLNNDPRGYSLKIDYDHRERINQIGLHQDWGGYGIIAPHIE